MRSLKRLVDKLVLFSLARINLFFTVPNKIVHRRWFDYFVDYVLFYWKHQPNQKLIAKVKKPTFFSGLGKTQIRLQIQCKYVCQCYVQNVRTIPNRRASLLCIVFLAFSSTFRLVSERIMHVMEIGGPCKLSGATIKRIMTAFIHYLILNCVLYLVFTDFWVWISKLWLFIIERTLCIVFIVRIPCKSLIRMLRILCW